MEFLGLGPEKLVSKVQKFEVLVFEAFKIAS